MNAFMNITIMVASRQAIREVQALGGSVQQLGRQVQQTNAANAAMSRGMGMMQWQRIGNQIQWTGRQLQYNWTLPLAVAGAAAVKFQLDNERAMTRVEKVYGDASLSAETMRNELEALGRVFEALSNRYGINQAETIEIGAAWAAAGVSGIALGKAVETTMRTMVLGQMEAAEATEALIAIQAQYGQTADELRVTIAQLNAVENATGISMQGLVQGFSRAAGTARSAGIDVRHLAAMLAALTPAAGTAAQAGNALKTIISRLLSPTREAAEVMGLMGIQTSAMSWQSLNAQERLVAMAESFEQLDDAQKAVVSSVVASRYQINKFDVLMRELISTTGYYQAALDATANDTKALATAERELNAVLESNPKRLEQIWVIMQNAMANVVQPLIPYIVWLANEVKNLMLAFKSLPPEIQKLILVGAILLALLGPMIRYVGSLITLFGWLRTISMGASLGVAALAKSLMAVAVFPFSAVATGVGAVFGAFLGLGKAAQALPAMMAGGLTAMRVLPAMLATIGRSLGITWLGTLTVLKANTIAFATFMRITWWGVGVGMLTRQQAFMAAIRGGWLVFFRTLVSGAAALRTSLILIFGSMGASIAKLLTGGALLSVAKKLPMILGRALLSPWVLIGAAILAVIMNFGQQIVSAFGSIGDWFAESNANVVESVINAWYALPRGVRDAMQAVINIVQQAAMAVYDLFSYLNPFARHSPSLVENVTNGMAEIARQFASVRNIGSVFKNVYADLNRFGKAIASFMEHRAALERGEQVALLNMWAPGSIDEFNTMNQHLANLQSMLPEIQADIDAQQNVVDQWAAALDRVNAQLDAAQDRLDALRDVADQAQQNLNDAQDALNEYANAPLVGMKEFEDQIWANEQAQKELRLEMLRWEEANGSIEDVKDNMASLAGEIEMLRAKEAELRAGGAGSDILGPLQDQIAGLEGEYGNLQDTLNTSPFNDMEQALEDLRREAEMLELEKELEFGPLQKEIEDLLNTQKELTFEQIINGIQQSQAEVEQYEQDLANANQAIADQEAAIAALEEQRDAIQAQYDAELAKLDQLESAYAAVEDAIRTVESALSDLISEAQQAQAELEEALREAAQGDYMSPGAQNFLDAEGANFPEVGGGGALGREGGFEDQSALLDQMAQDLANETAAMFDGIDMFGPIREKWNAVWGWVKTNLGPVVGSIFEWIKRAAEGVAHVVGLIDFGGVSGGASKMGGIVMGIFRKLKEPVVEVWNAVKEFGQGLWNEVGPEIVKFGELWEPISQALTNLWKNVLLPIIAVIGGALVGAIMIAANIFSNVLGPVLDMIVGILKGVIKFIRGFVQVLAGVFSGDMGQVIEGVKTMFSGLWDAIVSIFKGIVGSVIGIVRGFVEGIVDWFTWLWDVLVGNSIIPDMINAIIDWFKELPGKVVKIVSDFVGTVVDWFKKLPGRVLSGLGQLGGYLKDKGGELIGGLINGVKNKWTAFQSWWTGLVVSVLLWIGDVATSLWNKGTDFVNGLLDGVAEGAKDLANWWSGLVGRTLDSIGDVTSSLVQKGLDFITGLAKGAADAWMKFDKWGDGRRQALFNAIGNVTKTLVQKGKDFFQGLWNGAKDKWSDFTTWARTIPGWITNLFKNGINWLKSAGRNVLQGLRNGASEKWSSFTSWASGWGGWIKDRLSGAANWLVSGGKNILIGLKNGAVSKWGSFWDWVGTWDDRVKNFFSNAGSWLWNAGSKILQGLWDGMKSKWNDVKDWVGNLGGNIADLKGPERYDKRLLIPAGGWIMGGLIRGLEGGMPALIRTLTGVADSIAETFGPELRGNIEKGIDDAVSVAQQTRRPLMSPYRRPVPNMFEPKVPVQYWRGGQAKTNNFYGDLSFPNITDPNDAERFLENLDNMSRD